MLVHVSTWRDDFDVNIEEQLRFALILTDSDKQFAINVITASISSSQYTILSCERIYIDVPLLSLFCYFQQIKYSKR